MLYAHTVIEVCRLCDVRRRAVGDFGLVFGRQDAEERIIAEQLIKLRNRKDKGLHEVHHASP